MANHPDRDQLLALIQELRESMNAQLDILTAAVHAASSPTAASFSPSRRIAYSSGIVPTDIDKAKARAALRRMGIKP